ncbi:EAL domain-containing protein [Luteimonas sp. RD2P54]|uniref:EAL domain-containing protein n=1 Tax=Luteimonas endophytica TaxID=3042023 RepID=A0ABT6J7W1_9GAMM|nr:GGDEF domain-containing phosphodiesterase [Luteimonas endophytica]MDH5822918.1 EAL domain-containing protein [Luteimonas endophytica]
MLTDPADPRLLGAAIVLLTALVAGLVWLLRRRTRQRQRMKALRDREERLMMALWATGEHYWEYDVVHDRLRLLQVEAGARDRSDVMVERVFDPARLLHPDDIEPARRELRKHLDGAARSFLAEARVLLDGPEPVWVRARGRVVHRDHAGRALRVAGTALNITGSRQADRDRRIASEVLHSMSEAVSVVDRDFHFVSVNPAFLRITGYEEHEVIGANADLLDSTQHDAAFYGHIRGQLARHGRWTGEMWQRRKDGEEFLCSIEASVVSGGHESELLYVTVLNDITRQKRAEQELRYLANFDTLTNLPNRALLSERLSRAIVRARRQDSRIAVLFLDLDRFKDINDSLGHAAGDRILRAAAKRLQDTVGQHHTVARLSGDEFTVVLENLETPEAAERTAREIIMAFEAPLLLDERQEIAISPSIGISLYPDHGHVPTALLKRADTAMYQAKAAGRRTFMRYDDAMDVATRQRATLSGALRKVLDRGELRLAFQPRLALADSRITGVEALLRWSSDEHGEIAPADFIPLAEESGLILEIGEWVLREACLTLRRWQQHGVGGLTVAVNVSVLQLLRGDFPEVVRRVLGDVGLAPEALELELTESVLMANAEQTAAKLQAFRAIGVSLAIDDFGTGYSSLAYLKRLPITTIKIDKAFIDDLSHDPEDAAITSTVITMAHSLGLNVVAEGVETEAQLRFLSQHRCDEIQGFWLAQPLDPHACLAFIRNWTQAQGAGRPLPAISP